ncbi:MAG: PilN domain-containing protein [Candidatus Omnitrophota bacterium]
MIEINLLPEELRVKTKQKAPEHVAVVTNTTGFTQEKAFIYALPAILVLFVLLHFYFGIVSMVKGGQLATLNRKWLDLGPQKKVLDEFSQQYSSSSADASITQLLINQRVLWGQKLNKLSLNLPPGVWFNDIALTKQTIIIQGSVISLQKDELTLINKLLDNLKADKDFYNDFISFELSNVQKKTIGSYDVSDFVLTGVLKAK